MKRHFSLVEAEEMVMQPEPPTDMPPLSSSPSDTTDSGESDQEYVPPPTCSSSSSTEGEEDTENSKSGSTGRKDTENSESGSTGRKDTENSESGSTGRKDTENSESGSTGRKDTENSESGSTGRKDTENSESGWTGRNGQVWFPTSAETTYFVEPARGVTPGPTRYAVVRVQNVVSAFDLFFTEEMIDMIVSMTNLQGRREIGDWIDVDSTHLRAYMGLLILAGVYRSRGESTHSLWSDRSGRAIFRATMSCKRFHNINRALCFDDKLQRPACQREDKLAPIRSLWEMWTHRLPLLFNPGRDVTVDKQLVPFKGRCKFRQYMPSKPARYGLKIWITADVATSYAWKCQIYLGKNGGAAEVGQGKRVVMEMTEGLQGVTVTCDKFFTSFPLAQELLKKKIALVGMMKKNKPELPPNLLQTKGRLVFSSVFGFTKYTTAVSYVQRLRQNVILISTRHRQAVVTEGPKQKPEIITYYNHSKGGVDNLDKLVGIYSCRRKSNRWPLTLFFNMLDISAYNSYVIFTAVDPSWNKAKKFRRRLFLEDLGYALVSEEIVRRKHVPQGTDAAALVKNIQSASAAPQDAEPQPAAGTSSPGGKRGTCKLCTRQKKRTVCTCITCGGHICKVHQVTCCRSCWKK